MAEDRSIDLLDYLIIISKKKIILLTISILVFALSYLSILLFIDEEFRAKAVIIPAGEDQVSSLSSLIKGFSSLPVGLGGLSEGGSTDLYKTIIFSRTNLVKVINEFNLTKVYKQKSMEKTIEELENRIDTKETNEGAFEISILANTKEDAAKITNFVVDKLNETIVELNIRKSKENRSFLEKRYDEIKENLKKSEDSLRVFQEKSKMYMAEDQTKIIIETISKLESDLAAKQVEHSVFEKIYGQESPQTINAKIALEEYATKLNSIKQGEGNNSFLLSINSLPKESVSFLRLYRDVMINNKMLEVILPLYENARFQEQKEIPILQIIDRAVPPERKAYPQRLVLSTLITLFVLFISIFQIVVKETLFQNNNSKIKQLLDNLKFKRKEKLG